MSTPLSAVKKARSPHQPTGQWITRQKRLAIYLRDGFACVYCGTDLRAAHPANVTLDHLLPRSVGGDNSAANLVTACRACNCSRGARSVETFAPGGALARIRTLVTRSLNLKLAVDLAGAGRAHTPAQGHCSLRRAC